MKYIILQYSTSYFLKLLHLVIPPPGRHLNRHIIVFASPLPCHWFNVRSVRRVHHGDPRPSRYFLQIIILIIISSVLVFAFYATNSLSFSPNFTLNLPPNYLLGTPWPLTPQADLQYIFNQ